MTRAHLWAWPVNSACRHAALSTGVPIAAALALGVPSSSAAPPESARARTAAQIRSFVRGEGPLPALADVQDAAAAVIGTVDLRAAADRARWRGLLPRLDVRVGTDTDLDVRDSFHTSYSRTTTEGQAIGFEVAARWALGDLVFADGEVRAARVKLSEESARHRRLDRVTDLYFDRLQLMLLRKPGPNTALEAARVDGALRALTGGFWSVGTSTSSDLEAVQR